LRKQFLIPADEVYLHNGTVGSSPMPVLRAFSTATTIRKRWPRAILKTIHLGLRAWNEFRDPLAEFVGCTRDELALVRNATEPTAISPTPGHETR